VVEVGRMKKKTASEKPNNQRGEFSKESLDLSTQSRQVIEREFPVGMTDIILRIATLN